MINKKFLKKIITIILMISLVSGLIACSKSENLEKEESKEGNDIMLTLSDTDYSDKNNWLSFGGDESKEVDVFAIYPTITQSEDATDRPYVQIDNEMMHMMAAGWLEEAGDTFIESANVYAPFYRQLNGVELNSLNRETFVSYTNATPREDIFAAFEYYLINVNKGERPFILIGHSQGAHLVTELATTFLGNEKYYQYNKNHIITYAIGMSVTQSQIELNSSLKYSQSSNDVGVIVSWNTTAPSEVNSSAYKNFGTWKPDALVTNPISWKSDETPATASENKASRVVAADNVSFEMVEGFADAIVDKEKGILVCSSVDESQYISNSVIVSMYHRHDITFYHESIKQNIKDRIAAFK